VPLQAISASLKEADEEGLIRLALLDRNVFGLTVVQIS
jgi:hypothetical protein